MILILEELSAELSKLNENLKYTDIAFNAKNISNRYRLNKNNGERLLTKDEEAVSYALSRMPATYEVVRHILEQTCKVYDADIQKVYDIGAGTGAATWAMYEHFGQREFVCYEREDAMIGIGKKIVNDTKCISNITWKKFDITNDIIDTKADLVITSYMINELSENNVLLAVDKMWDATTDLLIIVEPGTPHGFSNIKKIRSYLLNKGANIVAPCTHQNKCMISEKDWCSFSTRVQRSKIHKNLKDGELSYEDEKFSYIVFSKNEINRPKARVLRHPMIFKGYVEFKICEESGIGQARLSKKDGDKYKLAKKKKAGDTL